MPKLLYATPKYRHHKGSGLAVVTLSGVDHYLGPHGTKASKRKVGDVLLVWRLDRLGRSMRHLVTLIDQLRDRNIGFRSVCDGAIDTTTPSGELIFMVFSAARTVRASSFQERTNGWSGESSRPWSTRADVLPMKANDRRIVLSQQALERQVHRRRRQSAPLLKISKSTLYRYAVIETKGLRVP